MSGRKESTEIRASPGQTHPLRELVEKAVKSAIESLGMDEESSACERHQNLFVFVRDQVRQKCMALTHHMTTEILSEHEQLLQTMVITEEQRNRRGTQLAEARRRKQEKQTERQQMWEDAGMRLALLRLEMARKTCSVEDFTEDVDPKTIPETESQTIDIQRDADFELPRAYQEELQDLFRIPWDQKNKRRFGDCPISMRFGLLLTCLSRQSLDLARRFIPLPSYATLYAHFRTSIDATETNLLELTRVEEQIGDFVASSDLPAGSLVSLAVDAMAMTSDRHYLLGKENDFVFVFYAQPLDRRFKCCPLYVMTRQSGQAIAPVQDVVDFICTRLSQHGLFVKFICADGDAGYNARHKDFFAAWYGILIEQGLLAAIEFAGQSEFIPVLDYLHLWKSYCNKIKNHPVTLSPDSLEAALNAVDLEGILHLGAALRDKSAIGRTRDSYAIQLFSYRNCAKCLGQEYWNEFMYLLPWTLQEEVVRNPHLTREDRLLKALLSLKLLLHYFDLCSLPPSEGVSQRYIPGKTQAVTFAPDATWPRVLNSALVLVQFTVTAEESWSFSRVGTHCLENFFGLVRRQSFGDDRSVTATRIVARGVLVANIMHDLGLSFGHHRRDNVGGVVISGSPPEVNDELSEKISRSRLALSSLELDPIDHHDLFSFHDTESMVQEWLAGDEHHDQDPSYQMEFTGKVTGSRIAARVLRRNERFDSE
jgi:hypothetical protein